MVEPYVVSSIVYSSLFGLLGIGLTLTYLTTKVPNVGYGSFVTVVIYTSFSLYRLDKVSPYFSIPVAFLVGGIASVAMYLGILRVLARRGSSLVALMISTLALDIAFTGIFGIYTDYLYNHYLLIDSKSFYQLGGAFLLYDLPWFSYIAPISLAILTTAAY